MAHECYVCGLKANISCDNFNPTNKAYIKDCPSAKGCSIQTHGKYWITQPEKFIFNNFFLLFFNIYCYLQIFFSYAYTEYCMLLLLSYST